MSFHFMDEIYQIAKIYFGRIAMTNLDSILKSKDITFPTKVHIVM